MLVTLTLIKEKQEKSFDVQVPDSQPIFETLKILQENMNMFAQADRIDTVRDKRTGRKIDVHNTYQQEKIYSGAELVIPE